MTRKSIVFSILAGALAAIIIFASLQAFWQFQSSQNTTKGDTLFQISQFNYFSAGNFEGKTTFAEIAKHGDFGIGTLDGLNGEMIALDGVFYQIPISGVPRQISPEEKTPYVTIAFFGADKSIQVSDTINYSTLLNFVNGTLPSYNSIYAIKIHGTFDYAKTRSVPMQAKPYPTIAEAVKNQTVFQLTNISATAVGFYFPNSMDGIDYAGYHLHLITDERNAGGHLLDCTLKNATIQIDKINNYSLLIP